MINDIKRGPLANSLVLHDFQKNPIDLKGWFYYVEEWFRKSGLTPTKISGRAGKNVLFDREKKRLEKEGFKSISDGVWIGALPPKVGTDMFDGVFMVELYQHVRGTWTLVVCWDDQIIKFDRTYIETLAADLYSFLEPAYGYAYQREFRYGPTFYPFGVIAGDDISPEERKQITRWGIEYAYNDGDYRTGLFRDVYRLNFITEAHLIQNVEGVSLQKWIESSALHGELKALNDRLYSWSIEKSNIPKVREALYQAGLLLSFDGTYSVRP